MGHDIYAYKASGAEIDEDIEHGKSIAYLRHGAFTGMGHHIYTALGAQDCDGGVSGLGLTREFTREQLVAAWEKLGDMAKRLLLDLDRDRDFLRDTLENEGDVFWIYFG